MQSECNAQCLKKKLLWCAVYGPQQKLLWNFLQAWKLEKSLGVLTKRPGSRGRLGPKGARAMAPHWKWFLPFYDPILASQGTQIKKIEQFLDVSEPVFWVPSLSHQTLSLLMYTFLFCCCCFTFYNCIIPMGFLWWEIQVAFPWESQL